MSGITLEQAQSNLTSWLAASAAVASAQEYEIDTGSGRRKLRRADAAEIRQQINFWDAKVKQLTPSARRRISYVVPK